MTNKKIPQEVERFILTSIASVPHMEALMLLSSSAPEHWTAPTLARRLYIPRITALAVLDDLIAAGAVEHDAGGDTYRYLPRPATLAQIVEQLGRLHRTHLMELTALIHARLE